jgi:glycosyltransferase involved in cell wall biosynthesis
MPMPGYAEIRLALTGSGGVERHLDRVQPDAIHVATEGPLGHAMRRICLRRGILFTTSFHTRFPDYLAERLPLPARWTTQASWAWLRRFHSPGAAVLAATPTLVCELTSRGFKNVRLWSRGVDTELFNPGAKADLNLPRPIFLTVGRVAVEKNLEAFLDLELPGTKLIVGDGPERVALARKYPGAVFLGPQRDDALAGIYAAADVFVFPSRTDTFGLVLLEALASGVPVAAFPATAPRDVIGNTNVGVLDDDLRRACLGALQCSRDDCRDFSLGMTWAACARTFLEHVTPAVKASGAKAPSPSPIPA